jgi:hypothetical protein
MRDHHRASGSGSAGTYVLARHEGEKHLRLFFDLEGRSYSVPVSCSPSHRNAVHPYEIATRRDQPAHNIVGGKLTMDFVWLLYIDRKGEIETRIFREPEKAKEAAQVWWKEKQWWHEDDEPLTFEQTDTQILPHSDEYDRLYESGECQMSSRRPK